MASGLTFVENIAGVANTIRADASTVASSYNSLGSTLSSATGGLITMPAASTLLSKIAGNSSSAKTVLTLLGLGDYIGDTDHVLISNAEAQKGAFKWVEMKTTPEEFATPEAAILFAGDPIYANNTTGAEFIPIGVCQSFSFSSGLNVVSVKELRCEENMVIPGKSQAGQLSISRLVGNFPSLSYRLHSVKGHGYNTASASFKPLFGVLAIFMTPGRTGTITELYFERCAINSVSMSLQAGQYSITENVNIVFGKCLTVGEATVVSAKADTTNASNTIANILTGNIKDAFGSAVSGTTGNKVRTS